MDKATRPKFKVDKVWQGVIRRSLSPTRARMLLEPRHAGNRGMASAAYLGGTSVFQAALRMIPANVASPRSAEAALA